MLSIENQNPENHSIVRIQIQIIYLQFKAPVTANQRFLKSKGRVRVFDNLKKEIGGLSDYLLRRLRLGLTFAASGTIIFSYKPSRCSTRSRSEENGERR